MADTQGSGTGHNGLPQPVRSDEGATIMRPRNLPLELENPNLVLPVAAYRERYGTTIALPTVVGRAGAARGLEPSMSADERHAFEASAATLRQAAHRVLAPGGVA